MQAEVIKALYITITITIISIYADRWTNKAK